MHGYNRALVARLLLRLQRAIDRGDRAAVLILTARINAITSYNA